MQSAKLLGPSQGGIVAAGLRASVVSSLSIELYRAQQQSVLVNWLQCV